MGELAVDAPDFLLGTEAVLAAELQLVVEALLLIGTARPLGDRPVCASCSSGVSEGDHRESANAPGEDYSSRSHARLLLRYRCCAPKRPRARGAACARGEGPGRVRRGQSLSGGGATHPAAPKDLHPRARPSPYPTPSPPPLLPSPAHRSLHLQFRKNLECGMPALLRLQGLLLLVPREEECTGDPTAKTFPERGT